MFLGCSLELIRYIRLLCQPIVVASLDYSEDDKSPLIDLLPDTRSGPVEEILTSGENEQNTKQLVNAMRILPVRDAKILTLYSENLTLDEIGILFKVTKEVVRQIIRRSILKMRKHLGVDRSLPVVFPKDTEDKRPNQDGEPKQYVDHFLELLKSKEKTMNSSTTWAIISPTEFKLVEALWPHLYDQPTKVNVSEIGSRKGIKTGHANILARNLIEKGVLLDGNQRSHYAKGTSLIEVKAKSNSKEEGVRHNLNDLRGDSGQATAEKQTPGSTLRKPQERTPKSNAQPQMTRANQVDEEIIRLEGIQAEIFRRLYILNEAKRFLSSPLPDLRQ